MSKIVTLELGVALEYFWSVVRLVLGEVGCLLVEEVMVKLEMRVGTDVRVEKLNYWIKSLVLRHRLQVSQFLPCLSHRLLMTFGRDSVAVARNQ